MAKDAQDREDLLNEASGLPLRVELQLGEQTVFCGFRTGGAFSFYWGQATVFQFNQKHELRRGFWRDQMIASYQRELHWLTRPTETNRMRLIRTPMSEDEHDSFTALALQRLRSLSEGIESARVVGQFPADLDVVQHVKEWLGKYGDSLRFAIHPGVGRVQK